MFFYCFILLVLIAEKKKQGSPYTKFVWLGGFGGKGKDLGKKNSFHVHVDKSCVLG